jgi:predicted GNAT superfamily acetyltransferase
MAVRSDGRGGEGFRFRHLEKPEEFRQVEEVVRAAFGPEEQAGLSPMLQRVLADNGGLVLGAFADIYLAGFSVAHLGWDGTTLYENSYLTVVRPEYQNHHLGFRLKAYQRDEVLKLGLGEVRWVFDPLQSRSAYLSIRRLGATPDRYYPHYFGQLADEANRGLETDRLRAVWSLGAPRVEERMAGRLPGREDDAASWARAFAIVETEPGEHGLRVPTAVAEPEGARAHLEIPFDLGLIRAHEPGSLRRWRHAVRDAFRAALDAGYVVDDFAVVSAEHERRSAYFLAPRPTPSGPPDVASTDRP